MSNFTPRLTAPSASDPLWIQVGSGGYNQCIYGSDGAPSVLPNCTGYVHGRCMEIAGVTTDNLGLSFGNAVTYYYQSSADWVLDSEPSLGAVGVYETLPWLSADAPHPGHVLVVEEIIDNDTITVSQSDYGGPRFSVFTLRREWGWTPYQTAGAWGVSFITFLRNPYVTPGPGPGGGNAAKFVLLSSYRKRRNAHVTKRIIQ